MPKLFLTFSYLDFLLYGFDLFCVRFACILLWTAWNRKIPATWAKLLAYITDIFQIYTVRQEILAVQDMGVRQEET